MVNDINLFAEIVSQSTVFNEAYPFDSAVADAIVVFQQNDPTRVDKSISTTNVLLAMRMVQRDIADAKAHQEDTESLMAAYWSAAALYYYAKGELAKAQKSLELAKEAAYNSIKSLT